MQIYTDSFTFICTEINISKCLALRKNKTENITDNLMKGKMINVLNNFSNQLIMVFADDKHVGYCFFHGGLNLSEANENPKMTAIKEFAILPEYDLSDIKKQSLEKSNSYSIH